LEKDHSKANIDIVVKETSAGRAGWHSLTFWYNQESNCFSNYGLHNTGYSFLSDPCWNGYPFSPSFMLHSSICQSIYLLV
jgi:hypothetical protein